MDTAAFEKVIKKVRKKKKKIEISLKMGSALDLSI